MRVIWRITRVRFVQKRNASSWKAVWKLGVHRSIWTGAKGVVCIHLEYGITGFSLSKRFDSAYFLWILVGIGLGRGNEASRYV